MNCTSCKAEWTPPKGVSISNCPFCGKPIFEVKDSDKNSEPHEILQKIVQQYDRKKLGDTLLKGMLSDLMPHVEKKYQRIFKQALDDKIGSKLLELEDEDNSIRIVKTNTLKDSFKNNNGFDNTADYVVDCFLFALGWIETINKEQYGQSGVDNLSIVSQQIDISFIDGVLNRAEAIGLFSSAKSLGISENEAADLINAKINSLQLKPYPRIDKSLKNLKDNICSSDWYSAEKYPTGGNSPYLSGSVESNFNPLSSKEINKNLEQSIKIQIKPHDFSGLEAIIPDYESLEGLGEKFISLKKYQFPPLSILKEHSKNIKDVDSKELIGIKDKIVQTFVNKNIEINRITIYTGFHISLFEIEMKKTISSNISDKLLEELSSKLLVPGIRLKVQKADVTLVNIEVPNKNPKILPLKSIIGTMKFKNSTAHLPCSIGRSLNYDSIITDLTSLPHLLIVGDDEVANSVAIKTIILSLIYKSHPSHLKFILIDPNSAKLDIFDKLEFHFLAKLPDTESAVVYDSNVAVRTLNSLNIEMDSRLDLLKEGKVKTIEEYNSKFLKNKLNPLDGHQFLPYLVVVIDELSDLIKEMGSEIESPLTRLAELSKVTGIHLVISTNDISSKVITDELISHIPAKIVFNIKSKRESKLIIDSYDANLLIDNGDALFTSGNDLIRIQSPYCDDKEIEHLADFIAEQDGYPESHDLPEYYDEESSDGDEESSDEDDFGEGLDEYFAEAARIVVKHQRGSTTLLQKELKIGYNRAGRIIDQLEIYGIVGEFEGSKDRDVYYDNLSSLDAHLASIDSE